MDKTELEQRQREMRQRQNKFVRANPASAKPAFTSAKPALMLSSSTAATTSAELTRPRKQNSDRETVRLVRYNQTFLLKSSAAYRDTTISPRKKLQHIRYEAYYEYQHIGVVERVRSGHKAEHWAYRSLSGDVKGRRGQIGEAVWELFDAVIREPIRRAEWEMKAAPHYVAPVSVDGILFNFKFREDCVLYGGYGLRYAVSFLQDTRRTWEDEHQPNWETATYPDLFRYSGQNGQPDLWTASYYTGGTSRYYFEHYLPLELTLRWLFLHSEFLAVRAMQELAVYDHSIQRLLETGEGLCSTNTYRELLGFTPSTEPVWKVYAQDHGRFRRNKFIEPKENFELVAEGDYKNAHRKFLERLENDRHSGCLLLLSPSNRLADKSYPSNQFDRTARSWSSIFGNGEEYWRQTEWERIRAEHNFRKAREAMADFERKVLDSSEGKPN